MVDISKNCGYKSAQRQPGWSAEARTRSISESLRFIFHISVCTAKCQALEELPAVTKLKFTAYPEKLLAIEP